jgi:uridylate kinase
MSIESNYHISEVVASIGGSMVRPNRLNQEFMKEFSHFTQDLLAHSVTPFSVIGGGGQARIAIEDLKDAGVRKQFDFDRVGIGITQDNANMVQSILESNGIIVTRIFPYESIEDKIGRSQTIIPNTAYLLGGMKEGQTSDTVTVQVVLAIGAKTVFNVSNTTGVHPRDAEGNLIKTVTIPDLTWKQFRHYIPKRFTSGMSTPFDPVAVQLAEENDLTAVFLGGTDNKEIFSNFTHYLKGENFLGTVVHP